MRGIGKICLLLVVLWHAYILWPLFVGLDEKQAKLYKIAFVCFAPAVLNVIIVSKYVRNVLLRTLITMAVDAFLIVVAHRIFE